MNVNTNYNIAFCRAIKLKTYSENDYNNMKDISRILNGNISPEYNEEQHKKIKNFFVDILGDYDGKSGVSLRKTTNGDVFLFSGEEAKRLRKAEIRENLDTKKNKAAKYKENVSSEARKNVENLIYKLSENGNNFKPKSFFKIKSDNDGIERINYESYCINYVPDKASGFKKQNGNNVPSAMLARVYYEENELNLKA